MATLVKWKSLMTTEQAISSLIQQVDSTSAAGSAQGPMQHQEIWKHGPPTSYLHISLDTLSLPHQEELWITKRQEDN